MKFLLLLAQLFGKKRKIAKPTVIQTEEVKVEMVTSRVELVKASGLTSSYKKKSNPSERWDVSVFKEGRNIVPEMFEALKKLAIVVKNEGGTLYITDLFRSWETQERNRNDFLSGKKKAFVAPPGGSFHQAGRAVDFSVSELNFQGFSKEKWLKKFWDLAKPLGFYPIIAIPDLGVSECWHFDFPGEDWKKGYEYKNTSSSDHVDYGYIAKCCIIDSGQWNPNVSEEMKRNLFIQSQLVRLGYYEIGAIDGIIGIKCETAMAKLGLDVTDLDKASSELAKRRP